MNDVKQALNSLEKFFSVRAERQNLQVGEQDSESEDELAEMRMRQEM